MSLRVTVQKQNLTLLMGEIPALVEEEFGKGHLTFIFCCYVITIRTMSSTYTLVKVQEVGKNWNGRKKTMRLTNRMNQSKKPFPFCHWRAKESFVRRFFETSEELRTSAGPKYF